MSSELWAIQTKLTQEDSTKHLVEAFQYLGLSWAAFPFPPMVGKIPVFEWQKPIVYYGSTGVVKTVSETPELLKNSRLFFDAETHQPTWYGPRYGRDYLNHGARHTTIKDFLLEDHPWDQQFFIRPNSGLKLFAGKVFDFADFKTFFELSTNNTLVSADTPIVVNSVRKIHREFRTWIVNREVAAAVQYRQGTKVIPSMDVPNAVRDFAREQARKCSPSDVFVLDVAEVDDGYAVVEINCFHSAGFYCTEQILDIVAEVHLFIKETL